MTTKQSSGLCVADLEATVASEFREAGFSIEASVAIAELSVCALCSVLGGSQVYWPKTMLNRYRDRRIYQLANGHNSAELAQQFDLAKSRIEQIVRDGRQKRGRL
nr:Mor transcription activator family protein [uncultured Holophaga sp.]